MNFAENSESLTHGLTEKGFSLPFEMFWYIFEMFWYHVYISCIRCFAFDKSFILEDFLQEATNWQFLSQLGAETLRLAGFSGHRYFQTFYKYHPTFTNIIQNFTNIIRYFTNIIWSSDFQGTVISRHFTNIIRSKRCSFLTFLFDFEALQCLNGTNLNM